MEKSYPNMTFHIYLSWNGTILFF